MSAVAGDQSPLNLMNINKKHKLMDARRRWEQRQNTSNSPFRAESYKSCSPQSASDDSFDNSPIMTSRGCALRSGGKGEQCQTVGQPINLANIRQS